MEIFKIKTSIFVNCRCSHSGQVVLGHMFYWKNLFLCLSHYSSLSHMRVILSIHPFPPNNMGLAHEIPLSAAPLGDREARWDIIPGVGLLRGLLPVWWVIIRFQDIRLLSSMQSWPTNISPSTGEAGVYPSSHRAGPHPLRLDVRSGSVVWTHWVDSRDHCVKQSLKLH